MIRITRILCPIDFSDIAEHAFLHAAAIARWYEARLTLVHVFANLPTMDVPPLVLDDATRNRLVARLREVASRAAPDVPIDCHVQDAAYVHEEILAQIATIKADLLVLGTHGRSGFQHLFLGSVTEKVIRKATCPTLVVPPRAPDRAADAPVQFRRILCPVDFSERSLDALAYAIQMAEEADARLTLLHVVEARSMLAEEAIALDVTRIHDATVAAARRRLDALIPERARTFCVIEAAVVEGSAYREVLRQAAENQSDLIVMGVHGRGAFDLLLFGSTTHHVIRASSCPVLVIRSS